MAQEDCCLSCFSQSTGQTALPASWVVIWGLMADVLLSDQLLRKSFARSESFLSAQCVLLMRRLSSCSQGRSMRASLKTMMSMPLFSFNCSLTEGSVGVMVQPLALLQALVLEKSL